MYLFNNESYFQQIRSLSEDEIKDKILNTLRTSDRFQSGKEIKKNISNWGLRKYLPPPIQLVIFDSSVMITTQYLKENTLLNLITADEGTDKIVLKKIAENMMMYVDDKKGVTQLSSAVIASTSSMSLVSRSQKIVPRSRTLRKRKMISSRISHSSDESYPSTTSGTIDDDDVESNRNISLLRKVGPLKLLEELIPRTPSFFGVHNPFRIPSPNKTDPKSKEIRNRFNRLEFNSKLAALKKSGVIIKNRQKLTAGQLKGEILIKKRKLDEKDIVTVENKIKRKRGRKPKNDSEVINAY